MAKLELTEEERIYQREASRANLLAQIKGLFKKTFLKGIFDAIEEFDKNAEEFLGQSDETKGIVDAHKQRKLKLKKEAFENRNHHYLARKKEADSRYIFDSLIKCLERVYELIFVDILRGYEIMERHHQQYSIVDNVKRANNMVFEKMQSLGASYNRQAGQTEICQGLKDDVMGLVNLLNEAKNKRWNIEKIESSIMSMLDRFDPLHKYQEAVRRIREGLSRELQELKEGVKEIKAIAVEEFMGR